VKETPILMSESMVLATLEGRKTVTRRVVKYRATGPHGPPFSEPDTWDFYRGEEWVGAVSERDPGIFSAPCPYGKPGDRLWVRETWAYVPRTAYGGMVPFRDDPRPGCEGMCAVYRAGWERSQPGQWKPSIHMPRWASRLTLEVCSVRVERLQSISEEDAQREGVSEKCHGCESECLHGWRDPRPGYCPVFMRSQKIGFQWLWDSINGKRAGCAWSDDPWVWIIAFRVLPDPARATG
jgi:hypothetical protein